MPLKDKEKRKAYDKAYRVAHSERTKTVVGKYYQTNRKKLLDKSILYGKIHAGERKIYLKNYRQTNPEKLRIHRRKYRAVKRGVSHQAYATNYIFERDGWICQICGQKINRRLKYPNPRSGSIDHIVPLSKDGIDTPSNVQASHLRCNLGKHATNKGQLRLFG